MNKRKINVITICSGYDSQMLACRRIQQMHPELEFDLIAWAEINKFAIKAHDALFPEYADRNMGDITKVDWSQLKSTNEEINLLFYSTPCQDFSTAGLGRGGEKGSGTRSSLLWETERAIKELYPKVLIGENVEGLLNQNHLPVYLEWLKLLESYGYRNYFQVLNATDFNVPQNRRRVFTISIRRDGRRPYRFPKPIPRTRDAVDLYEPSEMIPESNYITEEQLQKVLYSCKRHKAVEVLREIGESSDEEGG